MTELSAGMVVVYGPQSSTHTLLGIVVRIPHLKLGVYIPEWGTMAEPPEVPYAICPNVPKQIPLSGAHAKEEKWVGDWPMSHIECRDGRMFVYLDMSSGGQERLSAPIPIQQVIVTRWAAT